MITHTHTHSTSIRVAITATLVMGVSATLPSAAMAAQAASLYSMRTLSDEPVEFGDLDIDQLSLIKVISATLTPTQIRLIPAKTTVLDKTLIAQSGARNLNELLEIYVPNSQQSAHNTLQDHFGIRGIISDRDDKYLLRVNGKTRNNLIIVGAESERDLPLLGDFRSITVISGPASATYGAGALAGVLNLETHNGLTFEGTDGQIRQGFWDQFTAAEFRIGHKFNTDSGVFIYGGIADQNGSDQDDSPYVFGTSFTPAASVPPVVTGDPVAFDVPNYRDGGDKLKMKFHASYVNGPMELWARFTQGGGKVRLQRAVVEVADAAALKKGRGDLDRQFTVATTYKQDLSEEFNLETFISYNWYEHQLGLYDLYPDEDVRQEQEAYGRMVGTWTPGPEQSMALGIEYSHVWFDGAPVGYGPAPGLPPVNDVWETDTVSLLMEHQWHPSEQWTTFASARLDKHTYTDWMFSPRLALVFAPNAQDTFKLITARALRRNGDGELRREHVLSGSTGTTESLDSLELRYDRQHNQHWHFGLSTFAQRNEAIGFSAAANHSLAVGTFEMGGIEAEVSYRSDKSRLTLSHGYTKLLNAKLATPTTVQAITAEPYGYGDDLANWANHITKLALIQELDRKWSASTSLRLYWDFPGAQDLVEWNSSRSTPLSYGLADPGYDTPFGPSVYWNAGLEYRPTKRITLRADAFNILGWGNETLNKRNYYSRASAYSIEAPAIGLTAKVSF